MKKVLFPILGCLLIASCNQWSSTKKTVNGPAPADFDTVVDGKPINLFVLENENGIKISLTNYGARIVSVLTPDKNDEMADIALGYDNIEAYLEDKIYSGPIVGRYANRISDAKFTLDGVEYHLYANDGDNSLHGGKEGFDKKIWEAEQDSNTISMSYLSPDGEEGYHGDLQVTKTFTLNEKNELKIEYTATTSAPTVVNLSNHTLWNLKGEGDSTILDHYFMINADRYTPIDKEWIPTGEITPVAESPFDFTAGKRIGKDIDKDNEQLFFGLGYDHNFVLNQDSAGAYSLAAKLWEESTGRYIEIHTTEPGFQFYSGNFLDGSVTGKSGRPYLYRSALIFETQHFPDSPNRPNFPSTVLRPGETYYHLAVYEFGIQSEE